MIADQREERIDSSYSIALVVCLMSNAKEENQLGRYDRETSREEIQQASKWGVMKSATLMRNRARKSVSA